MSFVFRAVKELWTVRDGILPLRELEDVDLFDVSPVTYPAYEATSVGLRSAEDIFNEHIQSLDERCADSDDDEMRTDEQCADDRVRRLNLFRIKNNMGD